MDNLYAKFEKIKAFVFDVDGVMTDGGVTILENGEHLRTFNIKDGWALNKAQKEGFHVAVISAGNGVGVQKRLEYLKIPHIFIGVKDKLQTYQELISTLGLSHQEVAYMGDDIPDLKVMKQVGLATCPADAAVDIMSVAHFVSTKNGGSGAVRELIEKVLRIQGKWNIE